MIPQKERDSLLYFAYSCLGYTEADWESDSPLPPMLQAFATAVDQSDTSEAWQELTRHSISDAVRRERAEPGDWDKLIFMVGMFAEVARERPDNMKPDTDYWFALCAVVSRYYEGALVD
jgi:hypothetical protein